MVRLSGWPGAPRIPPPDARGEEMRDRSPNAITAGAETRREGGKRLESTNAGPYTPCGEGGVDKGRVFLSVKWGGRGFSGFFCFFFFRRR